MTRGTRPTRGRGHLGNMYRFLRGTFREGNSTFMSITIFRFTMVGCVNGRGNLNGGRQTCSSTYSGVACVGRGYSFRGQARGGRRGVTSGHRGG